MKVHTITTDAPDDRRQAYLKKVRALLTQAENVATTPEEAKAFSEKAQELMERYAFSQIELEALGIRERDEIVNVTFLVEAPYAKAKQDLWFRICLANNVKMVVSGDCKRVKTIKVPDETRPSGFRHEYVRDAKGKLVKGGYVYLTGFRTDVEHVEMLFTSLYVQATNEVFSIEVPSWENTKSFRNAFLYGYSHAIGSRLAKVRREVQEQEVIRFQQEQGTDLLPVLRSRSEQVKEAYEKRYGGRKSGKVQFTYRAGTGYSAGGQAASRADIGSARLGSRKALSS